ncbi:MAG: hypothetical protein C4294_07035 [Nitrospiraceae bacterium]
MFDPQGQPRPSLTMVPWPGPLGKGTRWYTQRHATTVHPADWLTRFFTSARQHGCQVIVSSWEYQQTLSFLADRQLAEEVLSVPPTERFDRLATGFDHLLRFLRQQDLLETVAYVELHNEVNASFLREIGGDDPLVTMRPYLERALRFLQERHPDVLFTAGYTNLPPYRADILPENLQVMHQHIYEYGHLRELYRQAGLAVTLPTSLARSGSQAPPSSLITSSPQRRAGASGRPAFDGRWFTCTMSATAKSSTPGSTPTGRSTARRF